MPIATNSNLPAVSLGRVLVVDNDLAMRARITSYLGRYDCPTIALTDPAKALEQIESGAFGLVLLDLQRDDTAGLDTLRRIRERSDIPVIVITGTQQDEIDRIVALELGADDCVDRPFHLRELLARAHAIIRRQELGRLASGNPRQRGGYRFLGWELRCRSRTLTNPAGASVLLTKSEYGLLAAFLETAGRTLSRDQLLHMTRTSEDIFDRSIDVQVLRLRRKLQADATQPPLILTERGVGYRFAAPVERLS